MPGPRTARILVAAAMLAGALHPLAAQRMTTRDLLTLPQPAPDTAIHYGPDSLQFGELRVPAGAGPHPVAVVIHGGCWLSSFGLNHARSESAALAGAGFLVWSLEYRRVGNPGGGWPSTFRDVGAGVDHVRTLARRYPIDLNRVVLIGHSAGGHLALWAAARRKIPKGSPLFTDDPLPVRGVVSLAGVPDLRAAATGTSAVCGDAIQRLVGGAPDAVPEHYAAAAPIELLPLGVPQFVLNGAEDAIVPPRWATDYAARAQAAGDSVTLTIIPEAGHFEVVAPGTEAWKAVEAAARRASQQRR